MVSNYSYSQSRISFGPGLNKMATQNCWSLWQRMPPRYQLTARVGDESEDFYSDDQVKSPRARSQKRIKTPRTPRGKKYYVPPEAEVKRPTIAGCSPTGSCHAQSNKSRFHFPNRKSGYIDHFKTQQRVNSARVKFSTEPPPAPYTPKDKERATTAPTFPLMSSSRLGDSIGRLSESASQCSKENQSVCSQHREHSGLSIVGGKSEEPQNVSADAPNLNKNTSSKDSIQRKFNVRDTDDGTMYIDNGKVIFFKKSRHNQSVLLKSKLSDGSFLASIRRDYLSKPKVIAMSKPSTSPVEEKLLERERVYYNQKVGHILDYYVTEDEDRLSIDDINRYTRGSPRPLNSRARSPQNARVRRIYFDPSTLYKDGSSSQRYGHGATSPTERDSMEDPLHSSYMTVNRKSKLHDRKFYLRTPHTSSNSSSGITQKDIDNCKCGICRIEMQLSLMAQLGITKDVHVQTIEEGVKEQSRMQDHTKTYNENATIQVESVQNDFSESESKDEPISVSMPHTEPGIIEVTVPKMKLDREVTDTTLIESGFSTTRTIPGMC